MSRLFTLDEEEAWRARRGEPMSVWEYLTWERSVPIKNEYRDGRIYPLGPFTLRHCAISGDALGTIANLVHSRERVIVLGSGMRLQVPATGFFTYASMTVVDGEPRTADDGYDDNLLNPTAIVEIASQETEADLLGDKFSRYQACTTLSEYVVILDYRPRVEQYIRRSNGEWARRTARGLAALIRLESLDIAVPLSDLYDQVVRCKLGLGQEPLPGE